MARKEGVPAFRRYTPAERIEVANKVFQLTDVCFKKGKIQKSMPILEALDIVDISFQTWNYWMKTDATLNDMYETYKRNRLEHMRHQAKKQVEAALYGELKLKDKEKVDIALRFLEKVDDEFKDRKEITVTGNDFTASMEELQQKAKLLIKDLSDDK